MQHWSMSPATPASFPFGARQTSFSQGLSTPMSAATPTLVASSSKMADQEPSSSCTDWTAQCWSADQEPWSKDASTQPSSIGSPLESRQVPPNMPDDAVAAAAAATAKLDALVPEYSNSPRPQLTKRLPQTRGWWPASSPGFSPGPQSSIDASLVSSVAEQSEHYDPQPKVDKLSAKRSKHSFMGEVVTSEISRDSNGWEITPPPQGLLMAAAMRLAQLEDLEEDRRKEINAASEAAASAVSSAVAAKLERIERGRLAAEEAARAAALKRVEVQTNTDPEPEPDTRLHADQQGWRGHPADEAASRGHTYREWVATHVGRAGSNLVPEDATADVVYGLWTCCESLDPNSGGCVTTNHSDEMLHCYKCGRWVNRKFWGVEQCYFHSDEPEQERWGSLRWRCCGKGGVKDSKYGKVGVMNPLRVDEKYGLRYHDSFRSGLHRKDRRKPVSAAVPIGMRWTMMCRQPRMTASETGSRNGCKMGRHEYRFQPCCSHCDLPLPPEGSAGSGPRAALAMRGGGPSRICPSCGTENLICMQCEKVIPAPGPPGGPPVDPPREIPPQMPPVASYVTPYQMPGAPPGPGPPPPPRYSLNAPSYGGFETPCRFHPGVWCEFRRTRLAIRQKKAEPLVVFKPPTPVPPPPPSPPRERPVTPPRDPPPTVRPDSPRQWASTEAQTDPPKGKPLARASQTITFKDISTQHPLLLDDTERPSKATQTERGADVASAPAWCKHTTKNEVENPSKSVIVRTWSTLPRGFVIPNDRFSEDRFANGAHEIRQKLSRRAMDKPHLRSILDSKRSKNARVRTLTQTLLSVNPDLAPLRASFQTWYFHAVQNLSVIALLMRAATKISSISRWSQGAAPAPPGGLEEGMANYKYGVGIAGTQLRAQLTVTERVQLVHAFGRWATRAAEESVTIRTELQWIGIRMRYATIQVAFARWRDCVDSEIASDVGEAVKVGAGQRWKPLLATVHSSAQIAKSLTARHLRSVSPKRHASPTPDEAQAESAQILRFSVPLHGHGHQGYPAPKNIDSYSQTDCAWEWHSDVERRGGTDGCGIHWPAETTEVAIQTSRRFFVLRSLGIDEDEVGTQTDFKPIKMVSACVQTEYNEAYGELLITRRKGRAAENKVVAMQQANPDPKIKRAISLAVGRIAKRRSEIKDEEARQTLMNVLKEQATTTTWAYSEKDPKRFLRTQSSARQSQMELQRHLSRSQSCLVPNANNKASRSSPRRLTAEPRAMVSEGEQPPNESSETLMFDPPRRLKAVASSDAHDPPVVECAPRSSLVASAPSMISYVNEGDRSVLSPPRLQESPGDTEPVGTDPPSTIDEAPASAGLGSPGDEDATSAGLRSITRVASAIFADLDALNHAARSEGGTSTTIVASQLEHKLEHGESEKRDPSVMAATNN